MSNNQTTKPTLTGSAQILDTIGAPRIGPYRAFFKTTSDDELLGAYLWGQAIGGAFQPILGMYEVALRNAIHLAASRLSSKNLFDSHPWYDSSRADALTIRGKTRSKVEEVLYEGEPPLRRSPQPPPDAVVAALSFGFWPSFLHGLNKREQPRVLTDAFPHHPNSTPRHWGFPKNVEDLIATLKRIQQLRNSVAHHEPIWKPHRLTGAETHWSQSVKSLRDCHQDVLNVMAWCCPASATMIEQCFATRIFRSICSTDAVSAFMADPLNAGSMGSFKAHLTVVTSAGIGVRAAGSSN